MGVLANLAICVCFGDLIAGIQACMANALSPMSSPQPHVQAQVDIWLVLVSPVLYFTSCTHSPHVFVILVSKLSCKSRD